METKQPTPEEQLFAVIQGAQRPPLRTKAGSVRMTLGARVATAIGPFDLPRVNQLLTGLIVLLVLWGVVNLMVMGPLMNRRLQRLIRQAEQHLTPFTIAPPLEGLKTADEYLKVVREQDPFHVGEPVTPTAKPEVASSPPKPNVQTVLSHLKRVGVALSGDPTVMIEDGDTHQTHFLKIGNVIGPFTVKEILPDRAILHAGDEDYELF